MTSVDYDKSDYYAILEIITSNTQYTSQTEIKKSYRKLALSHHPDKKINGNDVVFKRITAAYEILSDDKKKRDYDQWYRGYFRRWEVTEFHVEKEQRYKIKLEKSESNRELKEQGAKEKLEKERLRREKLQREEKQRQEKEERDRKIRDEQLRKEREREKEYIKLKHEQRQRKLKEVEAREKKVFEKRREEERIKLEAQLKEQAETEEQRQKTQANKDSWDRAKKRKEERRRKLQELKQKKQTKFGNLPGQEPNQKTTSQSAFSHFNNQSTARTAQSPNLKPNPTPAAKVSPHLDPSLPDKTRLFHKLKSLEEESTNLGSKRDELDEEAAYALRSAAEFKLKIDAEFNAAKLKYESNCTRYNNMVKKAQNIKNKSDVKHAEVLASLDTYETLLYEYESKFGTYGEEEEEEEEEKIEIKQENDTDVTEEANNKSFNFSMNSSTTSIPKFDFTDPKKPQSSPFVFTPTTETSTFSFTLNQSSTISNSHFSTKTNRKTPIASIPGRSYKFTKMRNSNVKQGSGFPNAGGYFQETNFNSSEKFQTNDTNNFSTKPTTFNVSWESVFEGMNLNGSNTKADFTKNKKANEGESTANSKNPKDSTTASDHRRESGFRL